jgi:hypothetical protein
MQMRERRQWHLVHVLVVSLSCSHLPRDLIYGLLGLEPCDLLPNYKLSIVEVYE